jgi:DNA-binding Lrp family transcriptional regulator
MKRIRSWTQAWTLDDTDRAIIALYQEDARRAYADIGSYVNLSAPAVCRRVQKLINAGVIEFTVAVSSESPRAS